ncbi:hypothetical protein C9374_003768 [Naegleria lovaniensis]|uniref:Uncharacterized protein n=1 Tax=Naegleria lovaniensis TaxID=51637 RepID=A0AA88H0J8_NAELO|nr:uncharacterized protein C9374_003768 [Naegleria lovaniensis]KAG2394004.1 hypothetical protein C9374_003768 [Naegleria lovaniensis]
MATASEHAPSTTVRFGEHVHSQSTIYPPTDQDPNIYYPQLVNQWLSKYTNNVSKRISHLSECSPSLLIILYEAISKDNPLTNPEEYPKFIREKKLTFSQNQYNLFELMSYLRKRFKHSFILRNVDERKLLERDTFELIKLLDWLIQLENQRVHPYVPHLDDENYEKKSKTSKSLNSKFSLGNAMDVEHTLKHRKRQFQLQRDKLSREHEAFIKGSMIRAQAREEQLLREFLSQSQRIEKDHLIQMVAQLKKKEKEMKCKLQDRKDSLTNFYKGQLDIIKAKKADQSFKDKIISKDLFLEYDKQHREFHEFKEQELELQRWRFLSQKEKEEFKLQHQLQELLQRNKK